MATVKHEFDLNHKHFIDSCYSFMFMINIKSFDVFKQSIPPPINGEVFFTKFFAIKLSEDNYHVVKYTGPSDDEYVTNAITQYIEGNLSPIS